MVAPRYTVMDFSSATSYVVEPDSSNVPRSVTVCGIFVANKAGTTQTVTFQDKNNNTVLEITVPAGDSEDFICKFVAQDGIKGTIGASAAVTATVFHTAGGV